MGEEGSRSSWRADLADLTPLLEEEGPPRLLWESCAIMQYLCNKHGLDSFYPTDPRRAGDGRQRDVLPDRHPLSAPHARHLLTLGFPQYAGEVGTSEGDDQMKAKARRTPRPRSPRRSTRIARSSWTEGGSSAATPSIADTRFAATLEFLRAIDYDLPDWAEDYMAAMESALGEAYTEPAADVRGYVAQVKSQAA